MPLPSDLERYNDCRRILDQALELGGGTIETESEKKAIRWRARAYQFRRLFRETYARIYAEHPDPSQRNAAGKTPWDKLIIRVEGSTVIIDYDEQHEGDLVPFAVKPTGPVDPKPE